MEKHFTKRNIYRSNCLICLIVYSSNTLEIEMFLFEGEFDSLNESRPVSSARLIK